MRLKRTVAPVGQAVTTADLKAQLRITHALEDTYLDGLIATAAAHFEGRDGWLNRALLTQTWIRTLSAFPAGGVDLPFPPLQSVTAVRYLDAGLVERLADPSLFYVNTGSEPGRIELLPTAVFPSTADRPDAVRIEFVCGYGTAADVPAQLKHAMKILAAGWYANREPVVVGAIVSELPLSVQALASPFKVFQCWQDS
ncbi:head-tail connector protein [Caulobacter sp. ErkDOM-E]|uniref:head-tail connector protein n=1 Tax=Caulobacter sp. ErkDOM-E TaxID=3402778 RepID=UPI003AF7FDF6